MLVSMVVMSELVVYTLDTEMMLFQLNNSQG